jgi:hypothetical protein
MNKVDIESLEKGKTYLFTGLIKNGWCNGVEQLTHESVSRKYKYMDDKTITLECGRKFVIDDNLIIQEY